MILKLLLAVLLGMGGGALAGAYERWEQSHSALANDLSFYGARVTVRLESGWESLRYLSHRRP